MAEPIEILPPVLTALLALIPLVALARAHQRTHSPRVLFAAFAFAAFVLSGVALFVAAVLSQPYSQSSEWIEFASDVVIVALFALSFLWPRREPDVVA